jgi:hypothetical protein
LPLHDACRDFDAQHVLEINILVYTYQAEKRRVSRSWTDISPFLLI